MQRKQYSIELKKQAVKEGGLAPVGYNAATLYCYSLLVREIAKRVYETFADILETQGGMVSQQGIISNWGRGLFIHP